MTIVKHANTKRIWLYNHPQIESLSDEVNLVIFLSQRDLNIIWNAIQNIGEIQGRVYTEATGNLYTMVDGPQMDAFRNWVAECRNNLGAYLVTNAMLLRIAEAVEALAARECCPTTIGGGSAGAGLEEGPPSDITSTEEDRLGDPPAGFADWEEYDTYKCDMAYFIINQMIADIATATLLAATYTSATALAGALVAALFTPIGWAIMIGLAGLALSLFLLGVEVSLLTTFLEDNKDELVCCMLDGSDVANSITEFGNCIDSLLPEDEAIALWGEVGLYLADQYLTLYATVDSFNRLYTKVPYEIPVGNVCDCGDDVAEYEVVEAGTETSTNPANPIVITMGDYPGGPILSCTTDARAAYITFSVPVVITVTNFFDPIDPLSPINCGAEPMIKYWTGPNFTGSFAETDDLPQINLGGACQTFGVVIGNGGTVSLEVTYMLE
jgi:hypothetical protein